MKQRCTFCGKRDHTAKNCPQSHGGQGNRNRMRCTYCGAKNHNKDACPSLKAPHNHPADGYFG